MKFYHFSDICLFNNFEGGMRWEETRKEEIAESLRSLLSKADEDGIDIILVTGGLFSAPPVTDELRTVSEIFSAHPGTEIVISAGQSDPVKASSPVLSFTWPGNVHFVGKGIELIYPEKFSAPILVAAGDTAGSFREEYERFLLREPAAEKALIAMVPDIDDEEMEFLADSGFMYIAAAGATRTVSHEILKKKAYRPGHFEPRDSSDRGAHGMMKGELGESRELKSIEFVPAASASYVTLNVKITTDTTEEELREAVSREMKRRRASNIYHLRITGERNPELLFDLESLKDEWRVREILMEAAPRYDYEALYKAHANDMIGYYISALLTGENELSPLEKKAMFYGLDALIKTASKAE